MLPCKDLSWAPLPHSMLFLMVEVTSLLHPHSLGGVFQQLICPNDNYSLFSGGSLGPSSYTTSVGSMYFICLVHLEITFFLRLLSRLGATPTLVNKTLHKVPFLCRER
jgi:hypothetical protein